MVEPRGVRDTTWLGRTIFANRTGGPLSPGTARRIVRVFSGQSRVEQDEGAPARRCQPQH